MQLNFESYGQGEPLIILHGLFGSLENWQSISRRLAERFWVLAVDQRNHGRSPHSPEMTYHLMAEDLNEFMESHHLAQASLLGHSMGGKTAMQFALLHPQKVEKLIVVDIAPREYPPHHREIFEALLSLDLASFQNHEQIEKALAASIPELGVRRFLLKNLARGADRKFHWKINLPGIYRNYDRLNQALPIERIYEKPALFIRGGKSDYIRPGDLPIIERWFPQAEVRTVAQAGHWVHADAPEELIRIILTFFGPNSYGTLSQRKLR
jgi:esterase